MEYRKLGKSEIEISAVALGTWAIGGFMWGGTNDDEAVKAINKSIDLGINAIDTAPVYGFGHSENIVGRAIQGKRDKVKILTKFGLRWENTNGMHFFNFPDHAGKSVSVYHDATKESVIEECEASLGRLGTDHIDLFQQHWYDPVTPMEETYAAVDQLLKDGKILAAGVSNFEPAQIIIANSFVPIASNQPPYSMINRGIEEFIVPYFLKHDVGVIVYSPLQKGLLTGKVGMDRVFPQSDHRSSDDYFSPEARKEVLGLLEKLKPFADAHGATLGQLAINWAISKPGITSALVGARNESQAEENSKAGDFQITPDEMAEISRMLDEFEDSL